MESNLNTLNFMSFNCRGYNESKRAYILYLLTMCDVLFIQEHWLSDSQLSIFNSINSDFVSCGVSGFGNDDVLRGRPFGGCAILWRKNINAVFSVLNTDSRRVCSVLIDNHVHKVLCFNVYLPYEVDDVAEEEFNFQLRAIANIIEEYSDAYAIVAGDFNVDLARNWHHTDLLNEFCDEMDLWPVIKHKCSKLDYTYHFNMLRFHAIDHFIVSRGLFDGAINSYFALHDVDNTSDHSPIRMQLSLSVERIKLTPRQRVPKPAWHNASDIDIAMYNKELHHNLIGLDLPFDALLCRDVLCSDPSHIATLNCLASGIASACVKAALRSIPLTNNRRESGRIPGWNEFVSTFRDESLFWHNLWVSCERPKTGVVADIMRRTRAQYHRAIRQVKLHERDIVNEKFAEALSKNSSRDLWTEVRRVRRNHSSVSSVVDGLSQAEDITEVFATKYQDLYTSVSYDSASMDTLRNEVCARLAKNGYDQHCVVSSSSVADAISRLKRGKGDGNTGLTTDHFMHACPELCVYVSFLFTGLLTHGSLPTDMVTSTVIPIPKGRSGHSVSDNYRGIALSSIFGKILDLIILTRYKNQLSSCDHQFGFKAKRSTNTCTMVVKEAIEYYVNNGSPVFCTMLDATKAFDRVQYVKLFNILVDNDMPFVTLRLLLNMYTSHVTQVLWNGLFSSPFLVKNGVKQGGIVSPLLFCVYLDGLLKMLKDSKVGCYVGHLCLAAVAYADDIVLLAPTVRAMRLLLSVCDDFASEYDVVFNASKSKCLLFKTSVGRQQHIEHLPSTNFSIGGKVIEFVDSWPHLGHILNVYRDDGADMDKIRNSLCCQINNVLCYFGHVFPVLKLQLIKTFCYSLYGSVLWQLDHSNLETLCITWRKGLRRVWNIPYQTHCNILPIMCNCLPMYDEFCKRTVNFINQCLNSDCELVNQIVHHGIYFERARSPVGRNALICCKKYNASDIQSINSNTVHKWFNSTITDELLSKVLVILELIFIRDGSFEVSAIGAAPLYSRQEVISFISSICND